MSAVGIGRRYHDARFAQFPDGERLMRALLGLWVPENIMAGRGITVRGTVDNVGHLHMMLARALHLAGVEVRVMGLQALARELQRDDDEFSAPTVGRVGALFVRKFEDACRCPLRPYEVSLVEELIDARMANNLAVFPWLAGAPDEPWWSVNLTDQIGERNELFEVGE
jgi:hypothetical protein